MTLQILFAPATNAIGRPALAVRTGLIGALIMSVAFLVGIRWGTTGLAFAWLGGMATLLGATILVSLPAIGISRAALARAVAPGLVASLAMAAAVASVDSLLPAIGDGQRLAVLVPFGAATYAALLLMFARPLVEEMVALFRPSRVVEQIV